MGIDVIGMGGVMSWEDAVEMILAGAKAVGFLSALFRYKGFGFLDEWMNGLREYMKLKGFNSLNDFRGLSVKYVNAW